MGSFGARDWSLQGAAQKLAHALVVNGIAHDVEECAGAGHSFLHDHSAAKTPVFAVTGWSALAITSHRLRVLDGGSSRSSTLTSVPPDTLPEN